MSIQSAYDSVGEFNRIAGRFDAAPTNEQLRRQLELIQEELTETILALDDNDDVGLIDGAADIFVTAAGFLQMLERKGFNVETALYLVTENNLSKMIFDAEVMENTMAMYDRLGIDVEFEFDEVSGSWACKNSETGKLLKPFGFKSVVLTHCVPKENTIDHP